MWPTPFAEGTESPSRQLQRYLEDWPGDAEPAARQLTRHAGGIGGDTRGLLDENNRLRQKRDALLRELQVTATAVPLLAQISCWDFRCPDLATAESPARVARNPEP